MMMRTRTKMRNGRIIGQHLVRQSWAPPGSRRHISRLSLSESYLGNTTAPGIKIDRGATGVGE